jgi:hypothetical protein
VCGQGLQQHRPDDSYRAVCTTVLVDVATLLHQEMQDCFQALKSRLDDAAASKAAFQVANHVSTLEDALSNGPTDQAQVQLRAWQRALKGHEVCTHTA